MKILHSLPKMGETLNHDAPLLKILRLAVPSFILISATTVFFGVKSHISEFLAQYPAWVQYPTLSIGFLLFSFAPDALNAVLVAYVVRSLLKKQFTGVTSIILICFCATLSVGLTVYSFKMSKNAAIVAAEKAAGEAKQLDVAIIDTGYGSALERIKSDYSEETVGIEGNYLALIRAEETAIASWEKKRNDRNTQWIDSRQDRHRATIKNLLAAKKSELDALRARKQAAEDAAAAVHSDDRQRTTAYNDEKAARHNQLSAVFSAQLSWLAGYAVFILMILASVREILYHRNGIEPKPIFGQFDFQPSPVLETLAYPFVYIGRHTVNTVRTWYEALPELKERPDFAPVTDYSEYDQKVIKLKSKDRREAEAKEERAIGFIRAVNNAGSDNPSVNNGTVNNATVVAPKMGVKKCLQCGSEYVPKVAWQKYCTSDCKEAFHAEKHGKPFNPMQYHKTKGGAK
ncbi:MAG TPA: hypothetical protein PKC76_09310 [Saprospiraceae bacterium]|nr:hypothetical protein [Saprospiraceae bacterium]HMP24318.1 hypothetical protein [Saprospiraceae bacterium]